MLGEVSQEVSAMPKHPKSGWPLLMECWTRQNPENTPQNYHLVVAYTLVQTKLAVWAPPVLVLQFALKNKKNYNTL